jgi:hypothetical protein
MDTGLAARMPVRLPRVLPRVGQAEDVLGHVASTQPLAPADELARWRYERIWTRAFGEGLPSREAVGAELRTALERSITDASQSRELLHLVEDLGGASTLGLASGTRALEEIRPALEAHATGAGDVAAAEFARWRLLVRADDALADRVAHEAVDALHTSVGDTAPSVQLVRAEPMLRERVPVADRLGLLGATTPRAYDEVPGWIDEVDAAVAARADVPEALRADIDRLRGRIRSFLAGAAPEDKPVGYGHHPDYAEVGMLGEQLRLADVLTAVEPHATPASLGDTLPW